MAHWVDPPRQVWVPKRAPRLTTAVVIALLVGAVIVTVTLIRQKEQTDSFADPILTLCAQGGETGDRLLGAGLCTKAKVAKVDPVNAQPAAELTSEQTDQVQSLVAQELAKRPTPKPVGPSPAQVASAVQAFVAANPTMFKAPGPTAEQVQTAVAAYLRAHPPVVPEPDVSSIFPGTPSYGYPSYTPGYRPPSYRPPVHRPPRSVQPPPPTAGSTPEVPAN